ncbi:MAG: hypothetical protein JJU20_12810 [Opitutales bacterium]|nr:hypothetical protein [Opitutales bacterium]
MRRVGIIDIGSNSIKSLVAERDSASGAFIDRGTELEETRISTGIGQHRSYLSAKSIERGANSVEKLWRGLHRFGPLDALRIVATSAVRDAANRNAFIEAIRGRTNVQLEVLRGEEEAEGIAYGVLQDPEIPSDLSQFQLFDQGGGSLEWIAFEARSVAERQSLPLGAVRLTERFIEDSAAPISAAAREAISNEIRNQFTPLPLRKKVPIVACGGGVAVIETLLGNPRITLDALRKLEVQLCSLSTEQRIATMAIPAGRADIMPACVIAFRSLLEMLEADYLTHSRYNLRYGLAARLLESK